MSRQALRIGISAPRSTGGSTGTVLPIVIAIALAIGCGQKGPPLPPLVLTPAAPADLVAERRGTMVDIRFSVPAANTDGSRPANVSRVDVYAFTGPATVAENEILKLGSRIATVQVKAPRDPNATIDPDDPASDLEPLSGPGLDQGAAARVAEELDAAALAAASSSSAGGSTPPAGGPPAVELPGSTDVLARSYVGVAINTRGRPGALSRRAAVPFVAAPPSPSAPVVSYDEKGVSISWTPGAGDATAPSLSPRFAYNVYDVPVAGDSDAPAATSAGGSVSTSAGSSVAGENRLTAKPLTDLRFVDSRIEWGARRCYTIRAVQSVGGLTVESEAPPPACTTLVDTFAPLAPSGLEAIASEGAISLIWDPTEAPDLAGYLVLRGQAGSGTLTPVTSSPIAEASFRDIVPPGERFVYAVQAVDTAGNVSSSSGRVEETAR